MVRKKVLNDIQQGLTIQPLPFKGADVRATLELDPVKRPWNKAQAFFLGVRGTMPNCRVNPSTSDGWIRDSECRWRHRREVRRSRAHLLPSQQAQHGNPTLNGFEILRHTWTWTWRSRPFCLMRDAEGRAPLPRRHLHRGSFAPSTSAEKKVTGVVGGWTTCDTNTTFCTNSPVSMLWKRLKIGRPLQ